MNHDEWTMPEDPDAPVTMDEAHALLAAWDALPTGATVPVAMTGRLYHRAPDFLRLAVEQANEVDRLRAFIAEDSQRYVALAEEIARLRADAMPLAETCESLRSLLAAEREKTEHSVPMKDILAARDLFDIGTPEYEAIDDIIAGKWGIGE